MQLKAIDTGTFKLDGGAMFGVVPKVLWSKQYPADENNLCTWAMRCLLIEQGDRLVLIDTGIGTKQDARFFANYHLTGENDIVKQVQAAGYSADQVTDVFFTHLHFDHCGGGIVRDGEGFALAFPQAKYWSHSDHWQWATVPNAREKASFLKENILPIEASGHLHFYDQESEASGLPFAEVLTVDGHTDKQMLPLISYKGKKILYCADLLPSAAHLSLPWVMGYDTRPLLTLEEKGRILSMAAADDDMYLYLEHDAHRQLIQVGLNEKGGFVMKAEAKLQDL